MDRMKTTSNNIQQIKKINVHFLRQWKKEQIGELVEILKGMNELEELQVGVSLEKNMMPKWRFDSHLLKEIHNGDVSKEYITSVFIELGKMKSLTVLTLTCVGINNNLAEWIGSQLSQCKLLTHLSFRGNFIGNIGVAAIAQGLLYLSKLSSLDMSLNEMDNDGFVDIMRSMSHHKMCSKVGCKW